jgi:hypothetical protein
MIAAAATEDGVALSERPCHPGQDQGSGKAAAAISSYSEPLLRVCWQNKQDAIMAAVTDAVLAGIQ